MHIAGSKFYFPNIVVRLVRSNLPPHQAVFRCPPQLNKLDIKSLVGQLYNLSIIDVRTMNYIGSGVRERRSKKAPTRGKIYTPSYKKVIVTMSEDFKFPDPPVIGSGSGDEVDVSTGAIRMPPRVSFGKGSANRMRAKINKQALNVVSI
ncbi:hypothetical protein BSLG_010044 [Batrachochytrium salamandrivorans]|nr:hypothetical protein BSLG_010044 [Batrachochytrium salamandrivorans]